MSTAILTIKCPDQKGLIASITGFIFENKGNIVNLDQHTDEGLKLFFMRLEWDLSSFLIERTTLPEVIGRFLQDKGIQAEWHIGYSDVRNRLAIFASKTDHCLYDLLIRHKSGELDCDIPVVISNHLDLEPIAGYFGIKYCHVPLDDGSDRAAVEAAQMDILEKERVDFIVLARYMRILSPALIARFPFRIINIHHSFLPAFKGAKPYHQAFEKGVKIIGATSHFVTEELDQGPIIHQDVVHVSHKDSVEHLVTKGRDIERLVLAEAVKLYLQRRIFVAGNKTFIL